MDLDAGELKSIAAHGLLSRVSFNASKSRCCDLNGSPSTPQKATPCRNLNSQHLDGNFRDLRDRLRRTLSESLELKIGSRQPKEQNQSRCLVGSKESDNNGSKVCVSCKGQHTIYNCAEFLKLSAEEKYGKAKELKLCLNCLKCGHFVQKCRQKSLRNKCNRKHNSLLHYEVGQVEEHLEDVDSSQVALSSFAPSSAMVLLSTVSLQVFDKFGKPHSVKAILDSGSQSSYISSNLENLLQLKRTHLDFKVVGLNLATTKIEGRCQVKVQSHHTGFNTIISCLVIPDITGKLPEFSFDISGLAIPKHIRLADPSFNKCSKIDMLLGADCFWDLLCAAQIKLGVNKPVLQKTKFGWVVSGPINTCYERSNSLELLTQTCVDVLKVLESGQFPLRKWVANDPKILDGIEKSRWSSYSIKFGDNTEGVSKTLGLIWLPSPDYLDYEINISDLKSQVQSPLGLLSPTVIIIKNNVAGIVATQSIMGRSNPIIFAHEPITIPRLELCGALVLSRLFQTVIKSLEVKFDECLFWSDSTIVLAWLNTDPSKLKTCISNRVSEIQTNTQTYSWHHISTNDNPADLLSRGVVPSKLKDTLLWWNGPSWLNKDLVFVNSDSDESNRLLNMENLPDIKQTNSCLIVTQNVPLFPFQRFSCLNKLYRVIAYCLKFHFNCKNSEENRLKGPLNFKEIKLARHCVLKVSQWESFPEEIKSLKLKGVVG
ncbi:hypothetical protein NQ318_021907 [Aromia moschata]|uniref:DUF1758 domain-containing protein n=1 Tax=Aromia moschata TaxID=1265417 RepID=A0AAV8Z672_9CUCU|nr:hypothetical protein NQ318_021907 [Aromia moschata]